MIDFANLADIRWLNILHDVRHNYHICNSTVTNSYIRNIQGHTLIVQNKINITLHITISYSHTLLTEQ